MDWSKIKESCPKAYKRGQDWWIDNIEHYQRNGIVDEYESLTVSERFLYDFFDGEGIYIGIDSHTATTKKAYFTWIDYAEDEPDYFVGGDNEYWDTRTEAEEQAFTQAFMILENKLNSLNK